MAAIRPSAMLTDSSSCINLSLPHNSLMGFPNRAGNARISGSPKKSPKINKTHLRNLIPIVRRNRPLRLDASTESSGLTSTESSRLTQEQKIDKTTVEKLDHSVDVFNEMKHRFLTFKRHKYLENLDHYQSLGRAQAPKFMVIACADSRVCPSNILGFQPGEAFMIRNVGNLVPPFEKGPTEVNAALEFAVNFLEVENIFVIGHSCCGGIQALMSMEDEVHSSSFIRNWVIVGKDARVSTKGIAANLSFEQQCRHCEKESINRSLINLLSYPWIEERARKRVVSIHGGYYDFVNCTFEKWTLEYKPSSSKEEGHKHAIKAREFWS